MLFGWATGVKPDFSGTAGPDSGRLVRVAPVRHSAAP